MSNKEKKKNEKESKMWKTWDDYDDEESEKWKIQFAYEIKSEDHKCLINVNDDDSDSIISSCYFYPIVYFGEILDAIGCMLEDKKQEALIREKPKVLTNIKSLMDGLRDIEWLSKHLCLCVEQHELQSWNMMQCVRGSKFWNLGRKLTKIRERS